MNIRNTASVFSVAILGCTLIAGTVSATTLTYSSLPAWQTDVTSMTNIDFTGAPAGGLINYSATTPLTIAGVKFTGMNPAAYALYLVNANASQSWYDWGSGGLLRNDLYTAGAPTSIRATLPGAGFNAVGFDLMTGNTNGSAYTIRVNGTTDYVVPTFARPTRAFFGITSDALITSVELRNPVDTYAMVDNFTFGTWAPAAPPPPASADTPEAATMMLCASGLVLISRKWKSRWNTASSEAAA
jgi:hypothetical protein